ncbi:hypothetical protein [Sphaerobacter sp.]|uniref:hypothetical protein n=1 Tax=Sphaerobacter sp. TaxID=2099654 RepID=UPI001D3E1D47|nr:hypothetical protein [Sphaerobacter sp.]MBX5445163.1 hypothetical protein [Sphaerobacter sp.]
MGHDLRSNQPDETGQPPRDEAGPAGFRQSLVWLCVAITLCAASAALLLGGVMGRGAPDSTLGKVALVLIGIVICFVAGGALGFAVRRSQAR